MNILIIGNGGREHALAWKASQSPLADKVFVAPGNAGTALEKTLTNINIAITDIKGLVNFAKNNSIGLTIVGPEAPLILGVVDAFQAENLTIFGPSQKAAQLEGSKIFAKNFMTRHKIPTADYHSFTQVVPALAYLEKINVPIVIKADGLAAGKGVIIAMTLEEAKKTVQEILAENAFGQAGHRIIIEEFLDGEEATFIVMVDGKNIIPMATSQDHKRIGNNDSGPNTGGMGAYSPAPIITDIIHQRTMDKIIYPTVQGMMFEGRRYQGFLYAGLMIDKQGNPKVIEFNCRFGDPETQPIMMRLQSDLVELCLIATKGELGGKILLWDERPALGVVMASEGYPKNYRKGDIIYGLFNPLADGCKIFHAGTELKQNQVITTGGRVLCITAIGSTLLDAKNIAYSQVSKISWPGCFYRHDIAYRALYNLK
ncbi:MAG: phosphoribosylamine--glycine ligase [Candidatus Arsenophonus melophagi]|nr:phosphoribosylamine--glycine ligase [Candidatus Arsenophonus melophagi]